MTTGTFLTSGDLIADRRFTFAQDLIARGDLAAAADLLAQALEIVPAFASAWFALGDLRERMGDAGGAIEAFRRAAACDAQDRHGANLRLARLNGADANMTSGYVRALFDQYADRFDRALVEGLAYRGPDILLAAVERACRDGGRALHFGSALDLGCGTGLAGAAFRPHVDWLVGVDLSGRMAAQARAKGLYDRLHMDGIVPFLAAQSAENARHRLIVAADVFVYFDDLAPVMKAAADVLASDGMLAFTVETHEGEGVVLRDTLRFAHSAAHVRAALSGANLALLSLDPVSTRTEKGVPVPGLVAAAAPAASSLRANAKP